MPSAEAAGPPAGADAPHPPPSSAEAAGRAPTDIDGARAPTDIDGARAPTDIDGARDAYPCVTPWR